ncbi:MAG TPA: dephospho-CoA kinase [Candidatus Dormibacteraeota bacterium]|nr:dephospho-CoA kinase [Candidatus Dormibacteraeota bacterium]
MRVGLTGGIGSGKSAVAEMLRDRGARIVDTDQLSRRAVAPRSEVLAEIAKRWPQAMAPDGTLDRQAMARIVFNDARARKALNALLHPRIRELAFEEAARAQPGEIVVFVVPLLFESDFWRLCDVTVAVIAPMEQRLHRVVARDAVSEEHARARMAAQIDPEEARRRADYVLENDGTLEELRARVDELWERLTAAARDRDARP